MRAMAILTGCFLIHGLCGCANFQPIAKFAKEGNGVSAVVKADLAGMKSACDELVETQKALNMATGASTQTSEAACKSVDEALAKLAAASTEMLDQYHDALASLAKGEAWSISSELKGTIAAVKKLSVDGKTVVAGVNIPLFSAISETLADALISYAREKEARRLLSDSVDWAVLLSPLKTWYVGAPQPQALGLYGLLCESIRGSWKQVVNRYQDFVECKEKNQCEPLFALTQIPRAEKNEQNFGVCKQTDNQPPSDRAASVSKALDTWVSANEQLKKDAFKPDAQALMDAIDRLRDHRDAIVKANQP